MTFEVAAGLEFQTTTTEDDMGAGYVDIYTAAGPDRRGWASTASGRRPSARSSRSTAACAYREFRADDVGEGFSAGDGLTMTAAVVEFDSREHRDEVMEKVMKDPRVVAMTEAEELADMSAMRYGGFETFVEP